MVKGREAAPFTKFEPAPVRAVLERSRDDCVCRRLSPSVRRALNIYKTKNIFSGSAMVGLLLGRSLIGEARL